MKILGAKPMLLTTGPKLVAEFWRTKEECLSIINNPTLEKILKKMRLYDFHVWIGDNGGQLVLLEYGDDQTPLQSQSVDDICYTDINVVGDADPNKTIWFVFEKSEWSLLEKRFEYKLADYLETIWSECEKDAQEIYGDEQRNSWALERLDQTSYYDAQIVQVDIELKGEPHESQSNR